MYFFSSCEHCYYTESPVLLTLNTYRQQVENECVPKHTHTQTNTDTHISACVRSHTHTQMDRKNILGITYSNKC